MHLTQRLRAGLAVLRQELDGCRVGVYAGDFGRFNRKLRDWLIGLDIVAIYLPSKNHFDQGLPPERDMDRFLDGIDCLLLLCEDEIALEMIQAVLERGGRIRVVNPLRRGHPLSLMCHDRSYRRLFLDAWEDAGDDRQAADGLVRDHLLATFRVQFGAPVPGNVVPGLHPFEQDILRYGQVRATCPVCGKALETTTSFVIPHPSRHYSLVCYRFHCHEEFFLLKEPYGLAGVYLPGRRLFVSFIEAATWHAKIMYSVKMTDALFDTLQLYALYNLDEVEECLGKPHAQSITAVVGHFASFGHYVRNELAGVQKILDAEAHGRVGGWVVCGNDHLDVGRLFPELAVRKVFGHESKRREVEAFRAGLQDNACVMLVHYLEGLCDRLAERIHQRYASPRVSLQVARQVERAMEHWPLVFVTLRPKRRWLSQAQGLARVLNALHRDEPGLAVVFDGLPHDRRILDELMAHLNPEIMTFHALECSKADTLYWGAHVDLHISPHGNGNYFTLIPNKPGVVHANANFMKMYLIPGPDGLVIPSPREDAAPCLAVYPVWEDEAESDPHQQDYELDWRELLEAARRIMALLPRRRSHRPVKVSEPELETCPGS